LTPSPEADAWICAHPDLLIAPTVSCPAGER